MYIVYSIFYIYIECITYRIEIIGYSFVMFIYEEMIYLVWESVLDFLYVTEFLGLAGLVQLALYWLMCLEKCWVVFNFAWKGTKQLQRGEKRKIEVTNGCLDSCVDK